ncbi:MAG: glycosyltransferase family 39 protein [Nitrososphaerota archaeon]
MNENKHKKKYVWKEPLFLSSIIVIGLLIRFYYFPFEIPLTLDAFRFFLYAMDTTVLGHLPTNYTLPNNGWPLFLSLWFSIFRFENFLDYVILQRTLTVILSVLTVIPTYLLCRKFFSPCLAMVGAVLVVFTPRLIQNSLGGTTDPLFIFLITSAILLFLAKNKIYVYSSFSVLALSALVRYESLLLIIPFSALFIIRFRIEPKIVLRYSMVLGIFVLTLLPLAYLRTEATGQDGLLSHVIGGAKVTINDGVILKENGTKFALQEGITGLIKYVSITFFPLFFIFIPYGLYVFFKRRGYEINSLILIVIFMLLPALYAYGRGIQEPRYVFSVLPIAAIISLYTIEKLVKTKWHNVILVVILVAIILSSVAYLEYKKLDYNHERGAVKLSLYIANLDGAINEFDPESTYVETAGLYGLKLPVSSTNINFEPKVISLNGESVKEVIQNGRQKGLSYLIVDSMNTKQNRKPFLNDVFYHEEKYPYLLKIFDSKDHGYKYHVKIFKINYEEFDSILNDK